MLAPEAERAIAATTAVCSELGFVVAVARIVSNSNKLGLQLLPCDVFARVAFSGHEGFQLELEIAQGLTEIGSPVASLDMRVEPRVYERDGFAFTLWRHYRPAGIDPSAANYAKALEALHVGLAQLDVDAPHFSERVSEAQHLLRNRDKTPRLDDLDRELLLETLGRCAEGSTSDLHASNCSMESPTLESPEHCGRCVVHRFRDLLSRAYRVRSRTRSAGGLRGLFRGRSLPDSGEPTPRLGDGRGVALRCR
jgi:hypothetical protein